MQSGAAVLHEAAAVRREKPAVVVENKNKRVAQYAAAEKRNQGEGEHGHRQTKQQKRQSCRPIHCVD